MSTNVHLIISPQSILSDSLNAVNPVCLKPNLIAQLIGAAPRRKGKIEACTFIALPSTNDNILSLNFLYEITQ